MQYKLTLICPINNILIKLQIYKLKTYQFKTHCNGDSRR